MSHVKWPHLPPLALRLRAAEAMLRAGPSCEEFAVDADASTVLDAFKAISVGLRPVPSRLYREEAAADDEGPAIDAYFLRVSAELNRQVGSLSEQSPLAAELLSRLDGVLLTPVCPVCCTRPAPQPALVPCRWTKLGGATDEVALATRGGCLAAIREIFQFAVETTAKAYEEACGERLQTQVKLATGHGARNTEFELALTGQTNEDEDDRLHTRIVSLSFDVDSTWVDDYLALAYVCVHECLAHGFCGVDIEDPNAGASTSFHEGWMDCVAAYVLEEALQDEPGNLAPLAAELRRQMVAVRAVRYNRSRADAARDVNKWICGEQAFHAFEYLFVEALRRGKSHGLAGLGGLAREHLVGFSLALNASDVPHLERASFYRAVLSNYGARDPQWAAQQVKSKPQVIDFIGIFLKTGGFRTLVQQVVAIP